MRIVSIREKTIDIASDVRSAGASLGAMTASVLAIHTDAVKNGKPLFGLAFDSIGRYGHSGLLRERFIPRLVTAAAERYSDECGGIDPHRAWAVMMENEKPGGHGERSGAVGLIDAALWDLVAKAQGIPLWRLLTRDDVDGNGRIAVYASGGHYRAVDDIRSLTDDFRRAMQRGHRRFKIKIGGATIAEDRRRIEAVLAVLGPGMTLALDGNGTFARDTAFAYLDALAPYPIAWIEEPVHPLDFDLHQELAACARLPIATGENLFSCDDARNLLRYGGLRNDRDVLQFDISLSYGIVEYMRILELLDTHGWARERLAPHAGHLLAAQCVAGFVLGLAEIAMDETTAFGLLTSELAVEDGVLSLSDAPGTGFETLAIYRDVFRDVLE